MNTRIKKTALFMLIIGLVIMIISTYFAVQQYQLITQGELVSGQVTHMITIQSDDGTMYKPEVVYSWHDKEQVFIPSYSSSNNTYKVGDIVHLRASEEGVTFDGLNGWIGVGIGFVLSAIFFIIGLLWFLRHIHRYDKATKLKRKGRRVNARFVRKDTTSYKINGQVGNIIYVQEEDSQRIFQTYPIFSEFSVKWLEEHVFDVYIDTTNPAEYYVDIEKHFGAPQLHQYT